MTNADEQLGKFLLDLYAAAHRVNVDTFRDEAFRLLEGVLQIQSGWWGTGLSGSQKLVVAQASLYKLPPSFLTEYMQLVEQDPLVEIVDEMGGNSLAWDGGGEAGTPAMNAFDLKYGLHYGIASLQKDPTSGVGMFISLFRGQAGPAFSEQERLLMQTLLPHMVQAWSINLRLALASQSTAQAPDACLVDGDGRISEISPRFANQLQAEFPDWTGAILPWPLLRVFIDERGDIYRGKTINIWNVKRTDGQIHLLSGSQGPSMLTPREEAVALAFSRGNSYKEIAAALNLSPGTVRSYLSQCYAKLGVKNKIELGNALDKNIRTVP